MRNFLSIHVFNYLQVNVRSSSESHETSLRRRKKLDPLLKYARDFRYSVHFMSSHERDGGLGILKIIKLATCNKIHHSDAFCSSSISLTVSKEPVSSRNGCYKIVSFSFVALIIITEWIGTHIRNFLLLHWGYVYILDMIYSLVTRQSQKNPYLFVGFHLCAV